MRVNFFSQSGTQNSGPSQGLSATITGPLILAGNPTGPLEATPKQYVDSAINSLNASNIKTGFLPVARLPAFTGDAASATGSGNFVLGNTSVVAGTYTKVTVDNKGRILAGSNITNDDIPPFSWSKIIGGKPTTLDGYGITDALKVSGSTVTGTLSLNLDPVNSNHAANKQFVDSLGGNGALINTGTIIRRAVSATPSGFLRCNGGQVSKTTYSALFASVKSSYDVTRTVDYTSYAAVGAGQPWNQQYDLNVSTANDITGWSIGSATPSGVYSANVIITKNRLYVLGGMNGVAGFMQDIQSATINADGTLGAWNTIGYLPEGWSEGQAVVIKNRVYLLCGATGANPNVYTTVINSDGTLNGWSTQGVLPVRLRDARAVVTKNRLYLIGGVNVNTPSSSIYSAVINNDGTLGAWSLSSNTLPNNARYSHVAVTKNRVYMLGGMEGAVTSAISTAPINADGTLGAWSAAGTLPRAIANGQVVVTKNYVFLIGGFDGNSHLNTVYSAPIGSDGTLGAWTLRTNLPYTVAKCAVAVVRDKIHLIGPLMNNSETNSVITGSFTGGVSDYSQFYNGTINKFDGSNISGNVVLGNDYVESTESQPGNGQPWQQQSQINMSHAGGDISGWTNTTSPQGFPHLIVTKNYAYAIAGSSGTSASSIPNQIHRATLNPDGTIGTWTLMPTALPKTIWAGAVFVAKNRVNIVGAETNSSNLYSTTIDPVTGEIGTTWTVTTGPGIGSTTYGAVAVISDRVYAVVQGGVYYATIGADGILGTWVHAFSLSMTVYNAAMCVVKKKVYLIGHHNGGSEVSGKIFVANIQADGSLSNFTALPDYPQPVGGISFVVTDKTLYMFGGWNGAASSAMVYRATINSDGTLGAWNVCTSLPVGMHRARVMVTSSKIYLIGGITSDYGVTSYFANFTGGLNDYSSYINGSFTYTSNGMFALPDMSSAESTNEYYFVKT